MEMLLSAVVSDLISRLISFLISKYRDLDDTNDVVRLQRALLRAGAIVEEAERRHIANRAMLLQLNQLRQDMCRGSYMLDAFMMRRTVHPSRRSPATASQSRQFISLPPPGSDGVDGLAMAARSLEAALSGIKELVVLLGACPRLNRQPYSAYLFMESCMFGRQLEKEQIIGILLQPTRDFDVLPIIGPHDVGKRTLVEHVCLDERVRLHFSNIHHLNGDDLDLPIWSLMDPTVRSLIVVDFARGDVDEEEAWRRFHSSMRRRAHSEIKIILISRDERHACLGTVPPLRLRAPRPEELWYFFRALAFGAADPEEHPDLLRVAMAICGGLRDDKVFASANIIAAALRADLSTRSWRRVQRVFAEAVRLRRPEKRGGFYYSCKPVKDAPGASCLFYDTRKSMGVARDELPKVTMLQLLTGGGAALPGGETRIDLLLWQSRVPPFASYIATCDIVRARQPVAGEKRVRKRRRGQHDDHRN